MFGHPMTLTLIAVLALLLACGIWLILHGLRRGRTGTARTCGHCRQVNRAGARFCANCGRRLE